MSIEEKLSNVFSSMNTEDLLKFLKDCDVEIQSVASGMGGIYLEGVRLDECYIYRNYKEGEGIMNFSRKVLEKLLKEHPKAEIKIIANSEIVPEYWNKACDCSIDICTVEEWAILGDEYLDESDCIDKLEEFIYNEHPKLLEEQFRALVDLELSKLEFKEYICLYVY